MNSVLKGYITLIRPANLPTAAGDILAGLAMAGILKSDQGFTFFDGVDFWNISFLVLASVLLYAGGVVLNDVFDSKLEIALIFGSVAFFIIGSLFPFMTDNGLTKWFTSAIANIYDTPFFGFIFMIIAGFVLVNTLTRGSKIIGKLVSGHSFSEATSKDNSFFNKFNTQGFNKGPFQNSIPEEPEYTDYEEVDDSHE